MSLDLLDFAHDVFASSYTDGTLVEWETAFEGKSVDDCRHSLRKLSKDAAKIKPTDFLRQWTRDHPRQTCPRCCGTGMLGEYGMELSEPCDCPEGQRMVELRSSLAGGRISGNRKMTQAERDNGIAWTRSLRSEFVYQSGRVKARRWGA